MGYMMAFGGCLVCKQMFSFNPDTVPSSSAVTGQREPICEGCMTLINEKRKAQGMAPFPVRPDAYQPQECG